MKVITLTTNPALDKSAKVDGMVPSQKLKCHSIALQPGGGGVNVSRLLQRLQVHNNCIVPLGGDTGKHYETLLLEEHIQPKVIVVKEWTRENLAIVDTQTDLQYRFGMPGKTLAESEVQHMSKVIDDLVQPEDYFVISGSLASGLPVDYLRTLVSKMNKKNIAVIVDSSGEAYKEALKEQLYLIKPNQRELAQLAGKSFMSNKEQEDFAMELITNNRATYVVVSLGARGAFLASKDGITYQNTPSVKVKSTIGAGDSMVAGLLYGIVKGYSPEKILKMGVACGVATTMNEGTNLASYENIKTVLRLLTDKV